MNISQNIFQRIKIIVERSSLSALQQREFLLLFAQTKDSALAPVLELFLADVHWVDRLYKNYEAKKKALITGSMDAWKDVIQEEAHVVQA